MPTPAQHHQHFPFYAAGIAYCGCKEHFGLTPVQADAETPDPPDPPTDLIVRAEQKRRADTAVRRAQKRNRQAGGASMPLYPHGSAAGYMGLRCSCDDCRAWTRNRQRKITAALKARGLPEGDARHGTTNGYRNYGCRCAPCTEAARQSNATRRAAQR